MILLCCKFEPKKEAALSAFQHSTNNAYLKASLVSWTITTFESTYQNLESEFFLKTTIARPMPNMK